MTPEHTETLQNNAAAPTLEKRRDAVPVLTLEEKQALSHYEKSHHLSTLPHADHADGIERSKGEVVFNTVTYKGIGWLLNAAISVYVTDLFMHGAGKKHFENGAKAIAPIYERITGATQAVSKGAARSLMMTLGLFSGGTILLYPIKKLEDNKAEIVTVLDKKINSIDKPSTEDLEIQEKAHKRLTADPKPSWGNVILGRVLGTVAVVGVAGGIARGRDETTAKYISGKIGDSMLESTNPKIQELGNSSRFRNMTAISMIEVYTSFIAEEVLYFTTRAYRSIWHKKQAEAKAEAAANGAANDDKPQHTSSQYEAQHTKNFPTTTVADHVIATAHQPNALSVGA